MELNQCGRGLCQLNRPTDGRRNGSATITAEVGGVPATAEVTVAPVTVVRVKVPSTGGRQSPVAAIGGYTVIHSCNDGTCGLTEHMGPSEVLPQAGSLNNQAVEIICQMSGQLRTNSRGTSSYVWDKLVNGNYVTDLFLDTPGARISKYQSGFSPASVILAAERDSTWILRGVVYGGDDDSQGPTWTKSKHARSSASSLTPATRCCGSRPC